MADCKCHNCGEAGHIQWICPKVVQLTSGKSTAELNYYNCRTKGHVGMNCPSLYAEVVVVPEGWGYLVDKLGVAG